MSDTFDVVVSRTFPVPAEQAWRAWSEADLVKRWWGRPASAVRRPMLIFVLVAARWWRCELPPSWVAETCTAPGALPRSFRTHASRMSSTSQIRKAIGSYRPILECHLASRMTASMSSPSQKLVHGRTTMTVVEHGYTPRGSPGLVSGWAGAVRRQDGGDLHVLLDARGSPHRAT